MSDELFSTKSAVYSRALKVDGRGLWVPPQALACTSEAFQHMFYGEYAEKEMEAVPLPEKNYEEVLEFLSCLIPHPVIKEITDENVRSNLKLADEYQVKILKNGCEKFLCNKIKNDTCYILENDSIFDIPELGLQQTLMNEHIIQRVSEMSLFCIQQAYTRPIKSNIFMAILNLKLQHQRRQVHSHCRNCIPPPPDARYAIISGTGFHCCVCGTFLHNEISFNCEEGNKGELDAELFKWNI